MRVSVATGWIISAGHPHYGVQRQLRSRRTCWPRGSSQASAYGPTGECPRAEALRHPWHLFFSSLSGGRRGSCRREADRPTVGNAAVPSGGILPSMRSPGGLVYWCAMRNSGIWTLRARDHLPIRRIRAWNARSHARPQASPLPPSPQPGRSETPVRRPAPAPRCGSRRRGWPERKQHRRLPA
jgi:hypothetical protein